MSKKSLFNFALPFFLLAVLFAATASAQTDSCSVKLKITRNDNSAVINGATATAVNEDTKKVYRSAPKGGMPYFAKLPEGAYRVTVNKVGYKRSAENFSLRKHRSLSCGLSSKASQAVCNRITGRIHSSGLQRRRTPRPVLTWSAS